jgi:CubicO group peptidase (beta-lactamase class C family)
VTVFGLGAMLAAAACARDDGRSKDVTAAPRHDVAASRPADQREAVDALVAPLLEDEWLVGVVVGVATEAGSEVWGHGRVVAGGDEAPTGDTVFEIGSVTKVFTALILAEMVREGAVKLEDHVALLLPPGVRVPGRGGKEITLEHLATHTSGLPRVADNLAPADPSNPYADYTLDLLYAFLAHHELRRDPGDGFLYSNVGVGLLGHALSLRDGRSYERMLRERICAPLGMGDTVLSLSADQERRLARGHDVDGTPVPGWDIPVLAAAGAIRSTANDMVVFLRANMGLLESPLWPAMRDIQRRRRDAEPGVGIGLAWHIRDDGILWHNGHTGGYHSFVAIDPSRKAGVVVLANSAAGIVDRLGDAVLGLLTGKPGRVRVPPSLRLAPEVLDRCVGRYEIEPGTEIAVVRRGGRLWAQVTGQPALGIYAETETRFSYRAVDARITFHVGGAGEADRLAIHQGGRVTTARRLE